jgi:PAS domain S-box-containing protein
MEYTPQYREILGFIKQDAKRFIFFYFIILGFALTMGYMLARNVTMSLKHIQDAARRIAGGDFEARVEQDSDDELGAVADSFNKMVEDIRESRDSLVQMNERLLDDIAKRRAVEESLMQSEQRLRTLIDAIPDSIFFKDAEGRHLLGNKAFEESFGFSPQELEGKTVEDLLPPDVAEKCRANDEKVLNGHKLVRDEEQMHGTDGNCMVLDTIRVPLYDKNETPAGLVGIIRDVTEQKMAEKALRENEEKLRHLFEFANDGIFIIDLKGNILDVNRTAHERLGYEKEELLSMHLCDLDPPEYAAMVHERLEYLEQHGKAVFESAQEKKDGTIMPLEINTCMMEIQGQQVLFSVARDITERKQAEAQTLASLKEKEILLQEIHHRVKNNMSIIMSLLRLQAKHINNKEVEALFTESQNRIKSMALIHEKLYLEGDLLRINFRKYVENLVGDLFRSYQIGVGEVSYSVNVDHVPMEIDMMVPCGLIINELVTNSLKHAFDGIDTPEIRINFTAGDNGRVLLMVGDNGQGFPESLDVTSGTSLGLQIVNGLVRQLGGTLELDRDRGTAFKVSFELPREAQG